MRAFFAACLVASATSSLSVSAAVPLSTQNKEVPVISRNNYPDLPAPAGPYSVAVRHNDTLYLSGMTAFGTPAQGKEVATQAQAIFEQLRRVTQAEGISMQNLLKVTVYVTSMDDIGALRRVLTEQYNGAYPASSLVRVAGLFSEDVNIEIEAVFALPAARS